MGTRKLRILLACADRALRIAVRRLIDAELPAEVTEAHNGPDALDAALRELPDLVVVTTELPGFDGLQLAHRLRAIPQLLDTPIIALGPRGDQKRKYQAFYVGVTDYVEFPFDGVEMAYRLRAPLRGRLRQQVETLVFGPLTLELATRTARLEGREAVLTPSEFAIVQLLATHPGVPMDTERLLKDALGQPAHLGNPQVVHTHIRNLRKKLEADARTPAWVLRHPAGYRWGAAT